ncbi:MAG: purine-nucleoside phosphorylase [Clostridia bacterium]
MKSYYERLKEAADYIRGIIPAAPSVGIVLGSGLGPMADEVQDPVVIPYAKIPHYPLSTVEGHEGALFHGTISGKTVLIKKGRFHYYEGHDMESAIFGIRVMKLLGINHVIITNAAGGINTAYQEGALMLITDHIGLFAPSALRGPNLEEFGPRFPDMTYAYNPGLVKLAASCARGMGITVEQGIYAYARGPNYETPAEIRALRAMGADAVGMSTVPEVVAASHAGMKVLGISCITNMAAGVLDKPLHHLEVMETADRIKEQFTQYVKCILYNMEV